MSVLKASSGLRPLLVMVVIASTSNGSGWDLAQDGDWEPQR